MVYQVSQHINNDRIFIVNKSTIENRLDAQYYNANLDLSGFIKLSTIAIVKGGKRIPKGYGYSDELTPYHYMRVADMDSDLPVDINNLMNISEAVFEILKRYEIREGELAISIAGTIGKTCILKNIPTGKRVILTENCAKILVKPDIELLPEYLKICIDLPIVKKQLDLNYIQTTIPKLGLDKILGIKVPSIPCIQKQKEIVDYINSAYAKKLAKETEAQQLLDSIDDYLLKELGIAVPNDENLSIKSRIFTVNLNSIERNRLDCNYFDRKYRQLLSCIHEGIYSLVTLGDITSFLYTGQTPKSSSYTEQETDFPIIKAGSYTGFEIDLSKVAYTVNKQSYSIKKGDIFVLAAAHQAEYIAKQISYLSDAPAPNTSFVGELLCIRAKEYVNSMYLYSLLSTRIYKTLLNREKRGQTSHLYSNDIKHICIPIPPIDKQNSIAEYIEKLRSRAKALREEGKNILENAKREVERMIIGY